MSSQPLPPKKEVALALLERSSVHVHLDPRLDGVVVPPWFKKKEQLVLQIGLNMPVPIPDLQLDDEGMSCTLSFNRSPFFCIVPWASVFAIVGEDGRGMVWPDDVPPEVAQQGQQRGEMQSAQREPPRAVDAARTESKRPVLEEVRAEGPKPKRTRKKPQVVPAPAADDAQARAPSEGTRSNAGRDRIAPVPMPDASRARPMPVASRGPAPKPQQPPRKPKRELPPYLRVVK